MNFSNRSSLNSSWIKASVAVLLIAVIAFVIYQFLFNKHPEEEHQEISDLPVVEITKKTLFREDQLPGEIQAYQDVLIYPKVPGFIKWIGVDRGSIVKKDQLMVEMYAPEYIARRDEAQAKLASAKATLAEGESKLASVRARLDEIKAKLLSDDSTYQRVRAASLVPGVIATNEVIVLAQKVEEDKQAVATWTNNVAAQENLVAALKDNVSAARNALGNFGDFASYLKLTAPFNGYITERNMHVGSFVGPLGTGAYPSIVRIQQLDLLRIVAPVPERDTSGVLPGASIQFSVSTYPGKRFTGTLARIGNYLDKSTRTMPVELNYENPGYKILPGMFCEIYWPTRRPNPTLFVPTSAVVSTTLDTFVCCIRNNKVEWVNVKKGQSMGDLVEIFGDIEEGELIAQNGSDELLVGTKVKPILVATNEAASPKERPSYHIHAH